MASNQPTRRWWLRPFLIGTLLVQTVTHLAWLPISTQVGQMAIPWLMSRGMTLYGSLLENRPPAEAGLLSLLFRLLPGVEPILLVRALNLIVILALTVLIYRLALRLSDSLIAALLAVLFWALWEPVYGNILFYFDTLVGLLLILTALIGINARRASEVALCGLLLGLATLFKQPAWAATILFALWLIAGRRWRDLAALAGGALVLPLLAALIFALQGNLQSYLFWNFGRYLSHAPGGQPLTGDIVRKLLLTDVLAPSFVLLALKQRRWLLIAVLWLGALANLLPNFSEIYVMAHLPLLAVMSGVVIASALPRSIRGWLARADGTQIALAGIALAIGAGWAWIVATPYVPGPLGRAAIPAYDEFRPVAAQILALRHPDDTLFVLPMSDGNTQLFALTGMMPPGMFVNSHAVFLNVPGVNETLLAEWEARPPDLIVYFPQLELEFEPGILPQVEFMQAHYHAVDQVDAVPFNGDAIIYRLNQPAP